MNPPVGTLTLADLRRFGVARVQRVVGEGSTAERLRELGFTPGTEVCFVRQAPLAGPIVVSLRGYQLCIRTSEALLVEVVSPGDMQGSPSTRLRGYQPDDEERTA